MKQPNNNVHDINIMKQPNNSVHDINISYTGAVLGGAKGA